MVRAIRGDDFMRMRDSGKNLREASDVVLGSHTFPGSHALRDPVSLSGPIHGVSVFPSGRHTSAILSRTSHGNRAWKQCKTGRTSRWRRHGASHVQRPTGIPRGNHRCAGFARAPCNRACAPPLEGRKQDPQRWNAMRDARPQAVGPPHAISFRVTTTAAFGSELGKSSLGAGGASLDAGGPEGAPGADDRDPDRSANMYGGFDVKDLGEGQGRLGGDCPGGDTGDLSGAS
jgi:hypothetical protein